MSKDESYRDNAEIFSLQVAENKRPDPGQHQLTSNGGQ